MGGGSGGSGGAGGGLARQLLMRAEPVSSTVKSGLWWNLEYSQASVSAYVATTTELCGSSPMLKISAFEPG